MDLDNHCFGTKKAPPMLEFFQYCLFVYFLGGMEWVDLVMMLGNFNCWGIQLIRIIVGQGPTVLAVGVGWDYLVIFLSPIIPLFLSLSLGDYYKMDIRLKYCLKWWLDPKQSASQF